MNIEEVSLLKIDIEGAEVLALKGAMESLRKRKINNILIEYHSVENYNLLIKMLEQLGYIYSVDSRYEISKDVKYINGHIMARLNLKASSH